MRAQISELSRIGIVIAIMLLPGIRPDSVRADLTYWIGEHTDFTGNGCPTASDLNTVTATLQSALNNNGWSGQRWTNANSWPADYMEQSLGIGGIDNVAGDNAAFVVYAGHGANSGDLLLFGTPTFPSGACNIRMSTQARLGTLAGNKATIAAYMTSCTMSWNGLNWQLLSNNEMTQQLGFHDSPTIADAAASDFFGCTGVNPNDDCWLAYMEDEPGIFTGDNSPIAFTYATSSSTCASAQNVCRLKQGFCTGGSFEPWSWYCWAMIDHGSGPCN